MMTTLENMMNDVIRKYGFEVAQTINFCMMIERDEPMELIEKRYKQLMK